MRQPSYILLPRPPPGHARQLAEGRLPPLLDAPGHHPRSVLHYSVRDQRYKLIYWYNEGFGIEGTRECGQDKERELFNCYHDPRYKPVVERMTRLLEEKMVEIGDEPVNEGLCL